MVNKMLWTEKYRPKNMNDLMGQEPFKADAKSWKEGMPNIILYGQAGTGKTAASGILADMILGEHKAFNFHEINASDDRRLDVVRNMIKDIATSMKEGDVPHKIIFALREFFFQISL